MTCIMYNRTESQTEVQQDKTQIVKDADSRIESRTKVQKDKR